MSATNGDRLAERQDIPIIPESLAVGSSDPAELEAWYGNFGMDERMRKVVLCNCKEIVRARYVVANEKISETRIDDLAHVHDNYLDFLVASLKGRRLRENNVLSSGVGA
jgi:hypothetical protein